MECKKCYTNQWNYPHKWVGLSSSWASNFNHTGQYKLTPRRIVNLEEIPSNLIFRKKSAIPPMFLKSNSEAETIKGLSSGAGSALVRTKDGVFKIKRCGYLDGRPKQKSLDYSRLRKLDKKIVEETAKLEHLGIMTLEEAENELKTLSKLKELGLSSAYEPIGIYAHSFGGKLDKNNLAHALVVKVRSDVRVDEVLFGIVGDFIAEMIKERKLEFNKTSGTFSPKAITERDILNLVNNYGDQIREVGLCMGLLIKEVHKNKVLVTYPNAWFSNIVVCGDGSLSLVDLQESIDGSDLDPEIFELLRKTELAQQESALIAEFESIGFNSLVVLFQELITGFREGYSSDSGLKKIHKSIIRSALENSSKLKGALYV